VRPAPSSLTVSRRRPSGVARVTHGPPLVPISPGSRSQRADEGAHATRRTARPKLTKEKPSFRERVTQAHCVGRRRSRQSLPAAITAHALNASEALCERLDRGAAWACRARAWSSSAKIERWAGNARCRGGMLQLSPRLPSRGWPSRLTVEIPQLVSTVRYEGGS
jgi:hypothetical protein